MNKNKRIAKEKKKNVVKNNKKKCVCDLNEP